MLIPLQHDQMSARRFPVITVALIVLNVLAFLGTHWSQEDESPRLGDDKVHILLLAAMHPELKLPPVGEKLVANAKQQHPDTWKLAGDSNRNVYDAWDARIRLEEDPGKLQAEMDNLCADYEQLQSTSINSNYAFVPASPKPWAYVTANFLHGGWMHLIGNMWFLWLAGFVLEDAWGRGVYSAFYLIAGAVALQVHAMTNPESMIPCLGASGAVAGLMGAFLVRFPNLKIEMGWLRLTLWGIASGKMFYRFKAPAYTLLPLWLLLEVFFGTVNGTRGGGVAHWAHVGGFVFGAVVGVAMKFSGLEQKLNEKVEAEVSWSSDTEIVDATELLHKGEVNAVIEKLEPFVAKKPNMVDAWTLLREAKWRKSDVDGYLDATSKMCAIYLKQREYDLAWQCFGEFLNVAGDKHMPAQVWLDLCGGLEQQQNFDAALDQYKNLIKAYPTAKQSVQAQIAAAKLCLNKLNRAADAVKWYEEAAASAAPHAELDQVIAAGMNAARKAAGMAELPKATVAVAAASAVSAPTSFAKPLTWEHLDAPPVWGHGANGDTIYKPDFSHEVTGSPVR